jgi:phage-related protein
MNVFELFAKLGLDTSEYEKGLDDSEKKGANFGKGLKTAAGVAAGAVAATTAAVGAGAKAFVSGVASVASYGDNIDKMSQKMNMSAEAYQEWDFVMQHAGTSIDSMQASIKTLSNAAETNKDAFEKLGISQEQIASMSGEELFGATITALQGMEDETERTYLAGQLLGRGATELGALLNQSAEETEAMKQQAHELGGVLDNDTVKAAAGFQDSLQNMQTSFDGMKNNMLGNFLPAFSTTMDGLSLIFSGSDVEGGLSQIEKGISGLAENLVSKAPQLMQIGGTILTALVSSISSNLPVLLNAAVPVILELANGIISAAPDIITAVISVLGTIGSALADPANLSNLLDSAVAIVMTISDAIAQNAPTVIPAIVEIIMQMLTALTDESTLMPLLEAGLSVITSVVQGILKAIPVLIKNLPAIISNITNFLVNSTPLIIQAAIELLGGIISAIPEIIVELAKATPQIISSLVSGLLGGIGQIISVGGQLLAGLWQGISDKVGWIVEKIKGFGNTVMNTIKGIFGIHSPSKVFRDEVGEMLALGLGEGFEKGMPEVEKDMINSTKGMADDISDAMKVNGSVSMDGYTMKATGGFDSQTQLAQSIGAMIDEKLSNISFTINNPVYIGQKKIDQQIKTSTAHSNVISGGR